jgi:hypothetical protein
LSASQKHAALKAIANGAPVVTAGKAKVRVGKSVVHVRFCSENARSPGKFKFNINPNTLSAEYELWICGSADTYYFMPVSFIRSIYDNPSTYEDRHHPGIKVVSVDAPSHSVQYATGGISASLKAYYRARLQSS